MLEEAVREEFGLRPVTDFEVEHTHKLGNPLVSNESEEAVEKHHTLIRSTDVY